MANEAPIVSFTFDDFPQSAATIGARVLEQYNVRGTFYAAGSLCNKTIDGIPQFTSSELVALGASGHEIGCHTFHHVPVTSLASRELEEDLCANASFFRVLREGLAPRNFSYPFGAVSPMRKLLLQRGFTSCRGIQPGINTRFADLGLLRAERLYGGSLTSRLNALFKRATAQKGWLILYTHDVNEHPSPFGCTPDLLEEAVRFFANAGVECLTIERALQTIQAGRETSKAHLR